ncbi:hypothetical protein TanjilG_18090 [Lupinus angustifolius]|uniref:Uncharacterized protein n=1 Tax=Lupinus angustifolius TaxID=3871 RepID=A0A1J7GR43_LUPAN|nr:hypothetical protein TanjilG_18090 [Lupinus angustifolius]
MHCARASSVRMRPDQQTRSGFDAPGPWRLGQNACAKACALRSECEPRAGALMAMHCGAWIPYFFGHEMRPDQQTRSGFDAPGPWRLGHNACAKACALRSECEPQGGALMAMHCGA